MPRAFAITAATPSIRVDAGKEGEFSFTVSNALGRPVRARFRALPEGATQASWLSIVGEPERDFTPDATQQITVKVRPPATTAQGTYPFHLLVASVSNPDEEYAEGPSVSVEVSPAVPPKPFPWWLVALAAGVVVIAGGGILLFSILRGQGLKEACDPAESKCRKGLVCVADRRICLASPGSECKADDECAQGRCTQGVCAIPPPGANCTADADCPETQKCVAVGNGARACLLKPGEACTRNIECSSLWCVEGTNQCSRDDGRCEDNSACRAPVFSCFSGFCRKNEGQACGQDQECGTGFCEAGRCQPAPRCSPPCGRLQICVRGRCERIILDPVFRFEVQPRQPINR